MLNKDKKSIYPYFAIRFLCGHISMLRLLHTIVVVSQSGVIRPKIDGEEVQFVGQKHAFQAETRLLIFMFSK